MTGQAELVSIRCMIRWFLRCVCAICAVHSVQNQLVLGGESV